MRAMGRASLAAVLKPVFSDLVICICGRDVNGYVMRLAIGEVRNEVGEIKMVSGYISVEP